VSAKVCLRSDCRGSADVTVAVPVVAVLLAVNVSVLVEVVGFVPNRGHTARKPDASGLRYR